MSALHVILVALFGTSLALDLTGCNGRPQLINTLMQLHGDIYSPGYLEGVNYPEDVFCQFILRAPFGFRIRISFVDMDIEPFDLCGSDALVVHEGDTPMGPAHGVFCGNRTYPDLLSLGNALTVVFKSDFMVGKKGFHLKYQTSVVHDFCGFRQKVCRNRNCFNITQTCDGKDDCGDGTDEENCGYPPVTTTCGIRPIKSFLDVGADRVIGGREATPGSWPWQADLQLGFFHPNGHMCGGTLINTQWVVTAAHCFMQNKSPQEWRLHFGNHHKYYKDRSEQVRFVERIIVYPEITGMELLKYEVEDMVHDIALMKLNAPVKFTDQVQPACLPTQGFKLETGKKCMATGWGMTRVMSTNALIKAHKSGAQKSKEKKRGFLNNINGNRSLIDVGVQKLNFEGNKNLLPSNCVSFQSEEKTEDSSQLPSSQEGSGSNTVLKEVELWIESAKTCDGDLGPINNQTMICVSNREGFQDVCHGDSGGPLVCESDRKWYVMGATSHGTAGNHIGGLCAMPEAYTVYAKISDKIDWIQKILNKYS